MTTYAIERLAEHLGNLKISYQAVVNSYDEDDRCSPFGDFSSPDEAYKKAVEFSKLAFHTGAHPFIKAWIGEEIQIHEVSGYM